MTWNRRLVSLFTISLVVGLASIARAQVTTGTISGTVTDPNGAVVAGANVKATSLATDATRTTSSDGDGHFVFTLLPPGRYRVEVAAQGFQTYQAELVVNITQTTTVNARMSLGSTTATVMVTTEAPVLQAETSQSGQVIESGTIRQLPLSTRNGRKYATSYLWTSAFTSATLARRPNPAHSRFRVRRERSPTVTRR